MRVMELHAPVRIVQRSKGRTATAAAAYRAAERIECERTGQVHDYTKKRGIEATELHAAEDAPDWTRDRAALWNAAEMREKHPRAQTAREIEIAFPSEFSPAQRREAGRNMAKLLVTRYGSATDVAWHEPNRNGDHRNHHAHIMFTARPVDAKGWAKNKRCALDERTPIETPDGRVTTRGQEEMHGLRAAIAGVLNDIAARDRLQVFVEHLSFEARGLDREATQHMGPNAVEMERRGEASEIGDTNRAIQARNDEREALREERDNVLDFAAGRDKQRRRNPWETYYRDTLGRRAALNQGLETAYGQHEAATTQQLNALQAQRKDRRLVSRLWVRLSGRDREEKRELEKLAQTLRTIELKKQEARERFDTEQRERLETLKAEIAAGEREDEVRFQEFLRRQEEAAPETKAEGESSVDAFGNAVYDDWTHNDDHALSGDELSYPVHEAADDDPIAESLRQRMRDRANKRGRSME